MMKSINLLKWLAILTAVFLAAILAAPLYTFGCWIDRDASELWVDTIEAGLTARCRADFE